MTGFCWVGFDGYGQLIHAVDSTFLPCHPGLNHFPHHLKLRPVLLYHHGILAAASVIGPTDLNFFPNAQQAFFFALGQVICPYL